MHAMSTQSVAPAPKKVRVFPAHLAPIDRFFLTDNTPTHPMTYVIRMDCTGKIDRDAFEQALKGAVERHPYTHAIIGPGKRGMLNWLDGKRAPEVIWVDYDDPIDIKLPEEEGIDLTKDLGLRIWVKHNDQQCQVLFQFHHSVTDGTGAFRFIGDFLALYDQAKGGDAQLLPLKPGLLRERLTQMAPAFAEGNTWRQAKMVWRYSWEIFAKWAVPLSQPKKKSKATFPGYFLHTFTRAEVGKLRDYAESHNATLNDYLLERLFQTVRDWNAKHGAKRSSRKMRVMMPSDLRDSRDTEMPCANVVGYTFLNRHYRDCDNPKEMLRGISNETAQIKHGHVGKDFIDALTAIGYFPWALPLVQHRGWSLCTMLLTNNGDPGRRITAKLPRKGGKLYAGGLLVEQFSGVPPIRRRACLAVTAMTYARELTICARLDPNHYGDEESKDILRMFIERLTEPVHEAPTDVAPADGTPDSGAEK